MDLKPIFSNAENIDQTEYYWFDKGFNETELEWVNNLVSLYPIDNSYIIGSNNEEPKVRESLLRWLDYDDNSSWLYDKLHDCVIEANDTTWNFNLSYINDSIQYTQYFTGHHYDWHVDIGPSPINHRKISVVVQLTKSEQYEGGDVEIWTGGKFKTLPRIRGSVILFPSFLLHRVTPITKGIRNSLVLWVGGNSYK